MHKDFHSLMLEFKMLTAVGIKECLKICLFQAGTLNLRPEGIIWNSRNKGWAESEIIFLLFLVTKSLKITWRASCCLPVNLLAKFTTLFNLFLSFWSRFPYHVTILKDKMLWTRDL